MLSVVTPRFLSRTDNGTLPGHEVIGDATYTTVGNKVTIVPNTTIMRDVVYTKLIGGSMLYSSARTEVREIVKADQNGLVLYLSEPFSSNVTVAETLKVVTSFPIKSLSVYFTGSASGILDGTTVIPNVAFNSPLNAIGIKAIAYNCTTNGSTLVGFYTI